VVTNHEGNETIKTAPERYPLAALSIEHITAIMPKMFTGEIFHCRGVMEYSPLIDGVFRSVYRFQ
jgi:hypothetical protein